MKRTVSIILTSFCAFFLSCCDCLCTTVTYKVEGWASHVSVEFNDAYGEREYHSSVALPWIKKFTVKYRSDEYVGGGYHGYTAYLKTMVYNPSGYPSGEVTVTICVNGEAVKKKSTTPTELTAEIFYAVHR